MRVLHVLAAILITFGLLAAPPSQIKVTVSPSTVTLAPGANQTFTASVSGTTQTAVTWSATGGTISSAGLFVAPAPSGTYSVKATSVANGTSYGSASVTVVATVAPTIATQPVGQTVVEGTSATFSVGASGTGPLTYQWYKNGVAISAANAASYTTPASTLGDSGATFTVKVTNSYGSVTSDPAILTVAPTVSVNISPAVVSVPPGGSQTFEATVSGTISTAVTWSVSTGGGIINSNGVYTASSLAGSYTITATSIQDATKKGTATVNVPITVTVDPKVIAISSGGTQQFSATITGTTNTAVKRWTASGGRIDSSGLYTAPTLGGVYTITASSAADTSIKGEAKVHVPITIQISPPNSSIEPGTTVGLTAYVSGGSTDAITWSATSGGLEPNGLTCVFRAPTTGGYCFVTATSADDPYWSTTVQIQVASLSVIPEPVLAGGSAILKAMFGGSAEIFPSIGPVQNGQNIQIKPDGNTNFQLKITNNNGSLDKRSRPVRVLGANGAFSKIQSIPINPKQSTRLTSGKILIGDFNSWGGESQFGVFDPTTQQFNLVNNQPTLNQIISEPTITPLSNGKALIVSGYHYYSGVTGETKEYSECYVYDPISNRLNTIANQWVQRYDHTATLLNDGNVLLIGGEYRDWVGYSSPVDRSSLVVFDPSNETFTYIAKLPDGPRSRHNATLLLDGRVLITGGYRGVSDIDSSSSPIWSSDAIWALIFDPVSKQFVRVPGIDGKQGETHLLADGRVFIDEWATSDPDSPVIFNPANGAISVVTAKDYWRSIQDLPDGQSFGNDGTFLGLALRDRGTGNSVKFLSDPNLSFIKSYVEFGASLLDGSLLIRYQHYNDSSGTGFDDWIFTPDLDVAIQPAFADIKPGAPLQLTATPKDGSPIEWSSSGGTVSSSGVFQTSRQGLYSVTATPKSGRASTCWVRVQPNVLVSVQPSTTQVNPGSQTTFQGLVKNDPGGSVTWSVLEGVSGGSIDASGVYTAPFAAGTFHVVATSVTDPSQSSSTTVTVLAPVSISPADTFLAAGATRQFSATMRVSGVDQTILWTASAGSIDPNGLYTAPFAPGSYTVTATSNSNASWKAMANVTVAQVPTILAFSADSPRVGPGGNTTLRWSTSGASSVYISGLGYLATSGNIQVSPTTSKTYTLTANNSFGAATKEITIIVSPVVALSISPSNATIYLGQSITLGSSITSYGSNEVTWSSPSGTLVENGGQATFTPPSVPGTYTVTVTSVADSTMSATSTIVVKAPDVSLSIAPSNLNLSCGATSTLGYNIQVTGSSDASVSWSATGGNLKVLGTSQAEYTAPAIPGTYSVTVQSNANPQVTSTATITVLPVGMTITPATITLAPGEVVQFGGSIQVLGSGTTEVEWSTSEGLLATIAPLSVRYTAPDYPGTYQITVTSKLDPNAKATATCTVDGSLAPVFSIVPSLLWLPPGGQNAFTAQIQGQAVADPIWSVGGPSDGVIDQQGLYTAPMEPGLYEVRAEDPASHHVALAQVSVGQLSVSPSSKTILPGSQLQFSALAGSSSVSNPNWSVMEGATGGTINSDGLYVAPSAPGIYHILVAGDQGAGTTSVVVGLIEAIAFSPSLQIEQAGEYVVTLTLAGSNGKQLRQSQQFTFTVGPVQPEVVVSSDRIRQEIGVDGPYIMRKVELQAQVGNDFFITDTRQDLGNTANYALSNFQRPWFVFNPTPTVMGLDSNNNGLVDQLKVTISVEVIAGGNYTFSAVLANMDFREVVPMSIDSVLLNPGSNQIVLIFDGKAIRARGIEGPYQIRGISLSGPTDALGPEIGPINFTLTQFEP